MKVLEVERSGNETSEHQAGSTRASAEGHECKSRRSPVLSPNIGCWRFASSFLYGDRPRHHTIGHAYRLSSTGAVAFTNGLRCFASFFRLVLRVQYRVRGPRARRGDSGLETKTEHTASNAICATKRKTRL